MLGISLVLKNDISIFKYIKISGNLMARFC